MKKILILICLSSFFASILLIYKYISYQDNIYREARDNLQILTADAAKELDVIIKQTMISAEDLAEKLSNDEISKENIKTTLEQTAKSNTNFYGATITFKPFAYETNTKFYSPYWYQQTTEDGNVIWKYLEPSDVADYTTPEYGWYFKPMQEKKSRWSEPYWGEGGKTYMISYSALIYKSSSTTEKEVIGLVAIDISMERIKKIIESLDIGVNGFGGLTTQEGNYLYHPNSDYVLSHKNLKDVAKEKNDNDRLILANKAKLRESGVIDHISTSTGEESWLIFRAIPSSGWSLQNTFIKSDINIDIDTLRQQTITITILLIIFFISLFSRIITVDALTDNKIWLIVGLSSLVLFIAIGTIWKLALTFEKPESKNVTKILSKQTVRKVITDYNQRNLAKFLDKPLYIPTGIYLETIKFNTPNDMSMTGRIWQKYPNDFPENLKKGFQISSSSNIEIVETSRQKLKNSEVIEWRFQSDVQVEIDYSRYPLEVEHVGIQILSWNKRKVILVPDLAAYKFTTATLLPGLSKNIFLSGWEITDSFFTLKKQNINTNFGVEGNFDQEEFPTLSYQVGIKRIFIDAFISNLTPLIVITVILFLVILLPTAKLDASRILGICVSAFFVVVFSHLAIRKNISIGEIFYLEYFFFVTYFAILIAPLNAFRVALDIKDNFFEYHDGLILKIGYWPTILSLFVLITILKFY
ncbi:MAG: hypothetical protein GQ569_12445 [Methylococcaceae bacterium]|nr:hypothetical protein [Methylococcaceae bacterium]